MYCVHRLFHGYVVSSSLRAHVQISPRAVALRAPCCYCRSSNHIEKGPRSGSRAGGRARGISARPHTTGVFALLGPQPAHFIAKVLRDRNKTRPSERDRQHIRDSHRVRTRRAPRRWHSRPCSSTRACARSRSSASGFSPLLMELRDGRPRVKAHKGVCTTQQRTQGSRAAREFASLGASRAPARPRQPHCWERTPKRVNLNF
jgi:hypothetical protein